MKTYSILKLIELHEKQTYILELMKGQRGVMLEKLAEMYKENMERIIYLIGSPTTPQYNPQPQTPEHGTFILST